MPLVLLPGFFSADCRVFPEFCDALLELTELSLRAAASGSAKGRFSTCLFMRRPVNGVDVHLVRNRDRLAAEAPRTAVGVLRRHLAPLSLHAALPCVEIAVASPNFKIVLAKRRLHLLPCPLECGAGLVECCSRARALRAGLHAWIKPKTPASLISAYRHASADADRPYADVGGIDVPGFVLIVFASAPGQFGHGKAGWEPVALPRTSVALACTLPQPLPRPAGEDFGDHQCCFFFSNISMATRPRSSGSRSRSSGDIRS